MKKHIVFATGSRADYGIMRRYLEHLNKDKDIDLGILATGALLDDQYGHQVDLIYEDNFNVEKEIKLPLSSRSDKDIIHTMAVGLDAFAGFFSDSDVDLLIILGDRYEMLSVAVAAAMQRIPILHIHGGEATFGNYDEFIRHSITKMSTYHFTATEEYRKRVIQLGENPEKVFYLGALGAENCQFIDECNVSIDVKSLPEKNYFVILFHPETLTNSDTENQVKNLLNAVSDFDDYEYVFIGANADTNSYIIRSMVNDYVAEHENTKFFENLHTDAYHYLLKNAICLIGNSSSGIIEAPSLGIYTINIGHRQDGRVKGNSIIDVNCDASEIKEAIADVLSKYMIIEPKNPYYKSDSASLYYQTTLEILEKIQIDNLIPKKFYDL